MTGDLLGYGEWQHSAPFRSSNDRGDLAALLPLDGFGATAARVIVVTDVPPGAVRGGHGHRVARQAIHAVAGTFDILVSLTPDPADATRVAMNSTSDPLVAGPGVWLWLQEFSADAVAVEVFDHPHDPAELIDTVD